MTAAITTASEFARRREERERERRQWQGSILADLTDDESDPPCAPASPARDRETRR